MNRLPDDNMKCQALFSQKNNEKENECRLLQFLLGALRVNNTVNRKLKSEENTEIQGNFNYIYYYNPIWVKYLIVFLWKKSFCFSVSPFKLYKQSRIDICTWERQTDRSRYIRCLCARVCMRVRVCMYERERERQRQREREREREREDVVHSTGEELKPWLAAGLDPGFQEGWFDWHSFRQNAHDRLFFFFFFFFNKFPHENIIFSPWSPSWSAPKLYSEDTFCTATMWREPRKRQLQHQVVQGQIIPQIMKCGMDFTLIFLQMFYMLAHEYEKQFVENYTSLYRLYLCLIEYF